MIWIDYAIIGLVSMALVMGLWRGLGVEVFSLAFWLLATGVGLGFCREFAIFLQSSISDALLKAAASFTLLFLITLTVGGLIRMLLGEAFKKPKLTAMDRLGGMIFGTARGMAGVVVLVILAGLTALPTDPWWKESKLLPPFQLGAVWLRDHIPSGLAKYIHYR
jgi:membrane protein required for colicin V production